MDNWTMLVYRIPSHPSRLRLQVWRRLQKMGALYLQDAVCILPSQPELVENMHYVAAMIEELGGSCHLFSSQSLLPDGNERIVEQFRALARSRHAEISLRLDRILADLRDASASEDLENAKVGARRERLNALRAERIAYFSEHPVRDVDGKLDEIKRLLESRHQGEWIDEILHP